MGCTMYKAFGKVRIDGPRIDFDLIYNDKIFNNFMCFSRLPNGMFCCSVE